MRFLRAVFGAALFSIFFPVISVANDVTLTSRDGSIELQGTLVGYDGEYYRIDTEYGVLTVDGSGVVCDGPGCPGLDSFVAKFTFSGTHEINTALLPALIESFAKYRGYILQQTHSPEIGAIFTLFEVGDSSAKAAEFTLHTNTSAGGINDLITQTADFALSLREVSADEASTAQEAGLGNLSNIRQVRVLALDAMVPIVSPDNPIRHLTMEQLTDIFTGTLENWSDVGGEDAPITMYLPNESVGFSNVFENQVILKWAGTGLSNRVVRQPSNTDMIQAILKDPFGIGIGQFSQTGETKIITLSGECQFQVAANIQSIKAEDYPLTTPLYLYLPARRLPRIGRDFLAFLRTDTAQLAVRDSGFVDQMVGETSLEEQGRRLANAILGAGDGIGIDELKYMAGLMVNHTRLSITFRFQDGSSQLDASSLSNVLLLADAIEAGQYDGRSIRFVGFADGQGEALVNQRLALKRAEAVLGAVRDTAETLDGTQLRLSAETLGEALPMACDDSIWGRQVNRRVEVWLENTAVKINR